MPFGRPTLAELLTQSRADFRSRLGIAGSLLRRAMADVLAAVWTGGIHMLHGHLDWLAKQLSPVTAEREALLVDASMYGITPIPAAKASGTVTATGTNGTQIPVDTILVRDDGVKYKVTVLATISGGTATVSVEAVLAGEAGNLGVGEILTFETPIPGINSTVTVILISGGVDEETTEALRTRFLERLRTPPQGGGDQDYIAWAKEVAGVTRVWVYRHEGGLGTVTVRFVRDGESPIFPDGGEVTAVQTKLNAERPTTAEVTAAAPTSLAVNFTIDLVTDTPAIRTAVENELKDLLFRDGEPGDGSGRGTIFLSKIRTAIGIAEGVTNYTMTAPVADVVPALGQLPTFGTITWT